jgi:hypothetical protein
MGQISQLKKHNNLIEKTKSANTGCVPPIIGNYQIHNDHYGKGFYFNELFINIYAIN